MPGVIMIEGAAQMCSFFVQKHDLLGARWSVSAAWRRFGFVIRCFRFPAGVYLPVDQGARADE